MESNELRNAVPALVPFVFGDVRGLSASYEKMSNTQFIVKAAVRNEQLDGPALSTAMVALVSEAFGVISATVTFNRAGDGDRPYHLGWTARGWKVVEAEPEKEG